MAGYVLPDPSAANKRTKVYGRLCKHQYFAKEFSQGTSNLRLQHCLNILYFASK